MWDGRQVGWPREKATSTRNTYNVSGSRECVCVCRERRACAGWLRESYLRGLKEILTNTTDADRDKVDRAQARVSRAADTSMERVGGGEGGE